MAELRDGVAIGIDAGGTKTLAVLLDRSGVEIARAEAAAANPWTVGRDAARHAIASVIEPLLEGGGVRSVCLGSAGIGQDGGAAAAEADVRALVPAKASILVCTDAVAALGLAGAERPAMVVVAGTGSIAYGERRDRSAVRLGGHGAVVGDPGSGAAIGLAALRHTAKALDKDVERGALADAVCVRLRLKSSAEIVERIHWPVLDVAFVASLAPLVGQSARLGDRAAIDIVAGEGDALAEDAEFVARAIRSEEHLVALLAGSIFNAFDEIRSRVERALSATGPVRIQPDAQPVMGAARLALNNMPPA